MKREADKNNKGGQKGNQNARKHGFYSMVLDEKEQANYERAVLVDGLDEEIALLRVKIISLVEHDPDNVKLITHALNAMQRLIETKYNIGKENRNLLKESIENVFKNVALPLGIKYLPNLFG